MSQKASPAAQGHNGGPPLDDLLPEWGEGPIGTYFSWKAAHRDAWKAIPMEIAIRRAHKAADLGLTYEEYTLEILERGRYLQAGDTKRIAEIKSRRAHDLME
ncbi:hypothetical protein [Microvirga puerhi]|uniref:Uncharacterized protein n=1 Tax=Microvirga puerhi TaxID=2876078 RepID=A0ABS7VQF0_9HYPH|nr:hypothetical protein [Microvirga puerhi]MBZ6077335.1 hypothetical protein [Microvirga puerhi]